MPVRFSKSVTESDSISTYKSQQKKDSLKTEYCNRNGIKLIRIPYTDFDNVENILDKHFS
nr:MAG TPA: restriction enzyme [Bacteriophage sp.]